MPIRDALVLDPRAPLPPGLAAPLFGVSFVDWLFVEAAVLDDLDERRVLAWLDLDGARFERARDGWLARVDAEMERDGAAFDVLYEDLLGRALAQWGRRVEPLDTDFGAWVAFERARLVTDDPDAFAHRLGLTSGDVLRLARSWRLRRAAATPDADPEVGLSALAADAPTVPKVRVGPLVFPPPAPGVP